MNKMVLGRNATLEDVREVVDEINDDFPEQVCGPVKRALFQLQFQADAILDESLGERHQEIIANIRNLFVVAVGQLADADDPRDRIKAAQELEYALMISVINMFLELDRGAPDQLTEWMAR